MISLEIFKKATTVFLVVVVSGCTTSARNTQAVISDSTKYNALGCYELGVEAGYLAVFGTELSKSVDRERTNDMVLISSLGLLSLPAINTDQTTPENRYLSEVKGDMKLIEIVSSDKNCPIKFESNEFDPYIVDNSTNPILGQKPVDRSVVYNAVQVKE